MNELNDVRKHQARHQSKGRHTLLGDLLLLLLRRSSIQLERDRTIRIKDPAAQC